VLLSSETRLRAVWALLYRIAARVFVVCLLWREFRASAYMTLEGPDFLPGLSDVDLVVVLRDGRGAPDAAALRIRRRAGRMRGRKLLQQFPIIDDLRVYEQSQLRDLVGSSALTYGLDDVGPAQPERTAFVGDASHADTVRLLTRPGLYGTLGDWRRLAGPDRRPPEPARDPQVQRIDAWLELVFWWRVLPRAIVNPVGPRLADLCVKSVAESVRIWAWLTYGEQPGGRRAALERGIELLPEEREGFRQVLALHKSLTRRPDPTRGLDEALPLLVRMSNRVATAVDAAAAVAGFTEVELAGNDPAEPVLAAGPWNPNPSLAGGRAPEILPLADWRALACPLAPDDTFAPLTADPADPAAYTAAARVDDGPYPTLRADRLLIRPATRFIRTRLRVIECRTTDPVSFALLDRKRTASFPNLRGWSIADTAARAVAEHRRWVHADPETGPGDGGHRELGMLLNAARAAALLESVAAGAPTLPLTLAEGARMVARTTNDSGAEEAFGHYRAWIEDGARLPPGAVEATRRLVRELPAYADAAANGRAGTSRRSARMPL
jgi:hypothetical protein